MPSFGDVTISIGRLRVSAVAAAPLSYFVPCDLAGFCANHAPSWAAGGPLLPDYDALAAVPPVDSRCLLTYCRARVSARACSAERAANEGGAA